MTGQSDDWLHYLERLETWLHNGGAEEAEALELEYRRLTKGNDFDEVMRHMRGIWDMLERLRPRRPEDWAVYTDDGTNDVEDHGGRDESF